MSSEEYRNLQEQVAQQQCGAVQGSIGATLQQQQTAARPTLRERIESQIYRCERDAHKLTQTQELRDLLVKHPDVARILELVEILGL